MVHIGKIQNVILICLVVAMAFMFQSCSEKGCTDMEACNFNADATKDDGSCSFADTWFEDLDQDELGNASSSIESCNQPEGYVSDSSDEFDAIVRDKQRAVLFYIGATWCAPCGSSGDPLRNYAYSTYNSGPSNDVILVSLQKNDLISAFSEPAYQMGAELSAHMSQNSVPLLLWVGNDYPMYKQATWVQDWANEDEVASIYESIVNDNAEISIAAQSKLDGSDINIDAILKFNESVSDEHYVSLYLLEDSVYASQDIIEFPYVTTSPHANILRAQHYSDNTFGKESIGSSFSLGQIYEISETITLPNNIQNTDMLKVAVIVWGGPSLDDVVNAYISKVY